MTTTLPSTRLPTLFIGHGTPMNALERNEFSESWAALGKCIGKPKAILMVSAHWMTRGVAVTAMARPRTIHDFGAFPQTLFDKRYPAPGAPELAKRIEALLNPLPVTLDRNWGFDHGTWSVLVHLYPEADVPVLQLSMESSQPPSFHYELGARLQRLRDEGVLIIGSGNVVHNLPMINFAKTESGFDWAVRFQDRVRKIITSGDDRTLTDFPNMGADADRSIPSADHFLPLLYVLGARDMHDDAVEFITPHCIFGSLSMMSIALWPSARP
ncbi:dioxygenase [Pseudomonas syringae]|uniref:Dioxygenase n=1 Tax=Pseudomonas syringae TaxID=317 RepID=A0A1C7Z5X3_PSESX|nr:4,5-DOPA dioxygenase extradiol [Pseudomonas syringae]OCR25331.1 dioxygenase [Pseudomonas syringae]